MYIQKATSCKKSIRQTKDYRKRNEKTKKKLITKERTKEQRERITRDEFPSPRPVKREPLNEASNWSSDFAMCSKVLQFHSLQIHHIKHNGTNFQMLEGCFPNQFHQPKRVSATNLGKTHEISKDLKTKLYS